MVPALVSVVVLVYTNAYSETAGSWLFLLTRFTLIAAVTAVCFLLVHSLENIRRSAALEEQARQSERILRLQRTQYADIQEHMETVRRARHDLRQHQKLILSFLNSGDTEALRSYLLSQIEETPSESMRMFCKNHPVNMLANYYFGQFESKGIAFEASLDLPDSLGMPESDFCVVLGNLLENALDACAGEENAFVHCAARRTGNSVALTVDNSSAEPPRRQPDGSFLSGKRDGRGIGTQSVLYIAEQYGGKADFRWENGVFFASVFLNLAKTSA